MCCELKINYAKKVLTYKHLLHKKSVVRAPFLTIIMCNEMLKYDTK